MTYPTVDLDYYHFFFIVMFICSILLSDIAKHSLLKVVSLIVQTMSSELKELKRARKSLKN